MSPLRLQLSLVALLAVFGAGVASGQALKPTTQKDLMTAMQGEAFAYLKYTAFAQEARAQHHPEVAVLFEKTANVEWKSHFATHAHQYGLVQSTEQNLKSSIAGENYETTTMYPEMASRAAKDGNANIAAIFTAIGKDEATHRDAFASALAKMQAAQ